MPLLISCGIRSHSHHGSQAFPDLLPENAWTTLMRLLMSSRSSIHIGERKISVKEVTPLLHTCGIYTVNPWKAVSRIIR